MLLIPPFELNGFYLRYFGQVFLEELVDLHVLSVAVEHGARAVVGDALREPFLVVNLAGSPSHVRCVVEYKVFKFR